MNTRWNDAMTSAWRRLLRAYEPIYRRGLLMDGLCRWPADASPGDASTRGSRPRRRVLLVALTGWRAMTSGSGRGRVPRR